MNVISPIKVMEKNGTTIKKYLVRSDPFKKIGCEDIKCSICTNDNPSKINCKTRECVYENTCENVRSCAGVYYGETCDAIRNRYGEHIDDYKHKRKESAFLKHCYDKHNGEVKKLNVKIIGTCTFDPMLRQCLEAVMIRENKPEMNCRSEWGNSNILRGHLNIA